MIQPPEDRRAPLTPQLALRVAVLGGVVLAMFAIVFFRLWFLQVLSGEQYVAQARNNRVRELAIPAPRGDIVDASDNTLVASKRAIAVQISPPDLPVPPKPDSPGTQSPRDAAVYRRLARVLRISTRAAPCKVAVAGVVQRLTLAPIPCAVAQKQAQLPYANVTVKTDVSKAVQYYLAEREDRFPGVHITTVYTRSYPLGTVAAQLFGTVGPISCVSSGNCELHEARYRGVSQNAIIGQSGLEYYYDQYLRGKDGADKVQVNALGAFESYLPERKPVPGHSLKLSLDVNLQKAGQQALQQAIDSNPPAGAGAFVALDPDTGSVLAMGSAPTFDPNVFTKPITTAKYKQLFGQGAGFPQLDRAIQSGYPTGSTFKGITATAALQSGAWSLGQTFDDSGKFCVSGECRHNAGNAIYGVLDIVQAIMVSSDDFFYNLGRALNVDPATHPNGGALQQWARAYGIGQPTGIDLGGENAGILPTPAWRTRRNQLEAECDNATGPFRGKPKHPPGGCQIADGTNRPWSVGDNENLAVGQGDLEATPLQLAVAYSAIANGGKVVRPHVGLEVDAQDGTLLQKIDPPPARYIHIDPTNLDAIRQGLRDAASQPGGTSADVFANFPEQVYGKTGTAQHTGQADQAWYVCFVPSSATSKPILVVVTVEQGGFGAIAAAPVAREILSQWFFGKRGQYVAGSSKTL